MNYKRYFDEYGFIGTLKSENGNQVKIVSLNQLEGTAVVVPDIGLPLDKLINHQMTVKLEDLEVAIHGITTGVKCMAVKNMKLNDSKSNMLEANISKNRLVMNDKMVGLLKAFNAQSFSVVKDHSDLHLMLYTDLGGDIAIDKNSEGDFTDLFDIIKEIGGYSEDTENVTFNFHRVPKLGKNFAPLIKVMVPTAPMIYRTEPTEGFQVTMARDEIMQDSKEKIVLKSKRS